MVMPCSRSARRPSVNSEKSIGPAVRFLEAFSTERRKVRYRTVGDMSCTGAVDSDADSIEKVIAEIAASRLTERGATRADDKMSEAAMEDRKREGYF